MAEVLKLIHERPDGEPDAYHLKPGRRYHIGRGSTCEIRILDMKMSRQHCAIEHRDGVWLLIDLGSTNGAYVDGKRVTAATPLSRNTVLVAGNTALAVAEIDDDSHRRAMGGQDTDEGIDPHSDLRPVSAARIERERRPLTRIREAVAEARAEADARLDVGDVTAVDRGAIDPSAEPPHYSETDQGSRTSDFDIHFAPHELDASQSGPLDCPPSGSEPADDRPGTGHTTTGRRKITITIGRDGEQQQQESEVEAGSAAVGRESDQLLFINVLGRRIGPVTRSVARDLKARELRGRLSEDDLAAYLDP